MDLKKLERGYADETKVDPYDPAFSPVNPEEPATAEEEGDLAAMYDLFHSYLYSEEGMAKVSQVLQNDKREIGLVVPDILAPMLLKTKLDLEKQKGRPVDTSVFVAEDGMFTLGTESIFDLAQQLAIPGAENKDQFAAALIGMWAKMGEHIENSNDEESIREAKKLGVDMLAARDDGTVEGANELKMRLMNKDRVVDGVRRGLGGKQNA